MRKINPILKEEIPAAIEELKLAMKEEQNHKFFVSYQVIYMLLSSKKLWITRGFH
ncbi:hypothetical protein [Metasolibacillus fluoroglycofenilyticus]|uniref:hypothetical protein n=1 Tax=Metasolibacillus fluoroglycofenilyticus TaxID=1239396 RepID=UPI001379D90C|nr:hypothetical protein [Metasolibacillus fluoroglycofenilyticus]